MQQSNPAPKHFLHASMQSVCCGSSFNYLPKPLLNLLELYSRCNKAKPTLLQVFDFKILSIKFDQNCDQREWRVQKSKRLVAAFINHQVDTNTCRSLHISCNPPPPTTRSHDSCFAISPKTFKAAAYKKCDLTLAIRARPVEIFRRFLTYQKGCNLFFRSLPCK